MLFFILLAVLRPQKLLKSKIYAVDEVKFR